MCVEVFSIESEMGTDDHLHIQCPHYSLCNMHIDQTFLPDNAIKKIEAKLIVEATDFFVLDVNEMEDDPLLRNKEEVFSICHDL